MTIGDVKGEYCYKCTINILTNVTPVQITWPEFPLRDSLSMYGSQDTCISIFSNPENLPSEVCRDMTVLKGTSTLFSFICPVLSTYQPDTNI